jgi:hypothetical protein
MIENLQPYHYSTYLQRVQDAGIHGLRGLELFQAHQLKRICQNQQVEISKLSISVADANPDALYPDEFADDHIEFWRQSFRDSKDLELLIKTIDKFIENSSTTNNEPKTPPPLSKGYYINLTKEQLTALYHKLVKAKFLKPTNVDHFVNAFNGQELENDFKPIEWAKAVYANLFIRINIADIDNPKNKVWQRAERLFNNGKAGSLKNAVNADPIDKHVDYKQALEQMIKSLQ